MPLKRPVESADIPWWHTLAVFVLFYDFGRQNIYLREMYIFEVLRRWYFNVSNNGLMNISMNTDCFLVQAIANIDELERQRQQTLQPS